MSNMFSTVLIFKNSIQYAQSQNLGGRGEVTLLWVGAYLSTEQTLHV